MYHKNVKIVKRSAGQSVTAKAAYHSCTVIIDRRTGLRFDFCRKKGLVHQEILAPPNAPSWAYDRSELWNQVEEIENRCNSQLARNITLALQHEFDLQTNIRLVRQLLSDMVDEGMIADVCFHDPDRDQENRNCHAHILLTMRELDALAGWASNKNRDWNPDFATDKKRNVGKKYVADKTPLNDWRENWAIIVREELERQCINKDFDHRSYADRGIAKIPQPHVGADGTALERKGQLSRLADLRREVQRHNDLIDMRYRFRRPSLRPTRSAKHHGQDYKKRLSDNHYVQFLDDEMLNQIKFLKVDEHPRPVTIKLYNQHWVYDFGSRISASASSDLTVKMMFDLAEAKGWVQIDLRGDQKFVKEAITELEHRSHFKFGNVTLVDDLESDQQLDDDQDDGVRMR